MEDENEGDEDEDEDDVPLVRRRENRRDSLHATRRRTVFIDLSGVEPVG